MPHLSSGSLRPQQGTMENNTLTCNPATFSQVFGRQGQLMQAGEYPGRSSSFIAWPLKLGEGWLELYRYIDIRWECFPLIIVGCLLAAYFIKYCRCVCFLRFYNMYVLCTPKKIDVSNCCAVSVIGGNIVQHEFCTDDLEWKSGIGPKEHGSLKSPGKPNNIAPLMIQC